MIQLMVASRHLQLETLSAEPAKDKLESYRGTILAQARDMTTIVVQLGASNHLARCDISQLEYDAGADAQWWRIGCCSQDASS